MIDELRTLYDQWTKQRLVLEKCDDFIEITTPFVDMHHDYIQLFFTTEKNNSFTISDDGHTISELEMLGIDTSATQKRKTFFHNTLTIFGVNFNKDTSELFVNFSSLEDYPKRMHNLLQCILRISDMLLTARNTVVSIFTEEILGFFEDEDVPFLENPSFVGRTGNNFTFDFAIARSKKRKEKLIKAVNTPNKDNYSLPLLSFIDVKDSKPNAEFIVLANDTNIEIADKFRTPFEKYDIQVLEWSKRKEWISSLKSS